MNNNKKNLNPQLNLRAVMNEQNVSSTELGYRLGIKRQTINNVASGKKDITVSRLHDYADALGVRVKSLFKD